MSKRFFLEHTRLIHSHLLTKRDPEICNVCGIDLTIRHILTECRGFDRERYIFNLGVNIDEMLATNRRN